MPEAVPDYYGLFGIARTASEDEIRRAYRRLARLVHPDSGSKSDGGVLPDIRLVNEAWDVLGDPETRAIYDQATADTRRTGPGADEEWVAPNVPPVPRGFARHPRPRHWGMGGLMERFADARRGAASLYGLTPDLSGLSQLGDDDLWLLDLGRLPVRDSDLRALSRFRRLEALLFDDSPIGDAALEWLRPLPALHTLSLTGCKITDGGIPALRAMESLRTLELDETAITDDGLMMLEGHPSLLVLDVRRTKVRGRGVGYLRDLPALRELRVPGSAERAARKIFAERPEVNVL